MHLVFVPKVVIFLFVAMTAAIFCRSAGDEGAMKGQRVTVGDLLALVRRPSCCFAVFDFLLFS